MAVASFKLSQPWRLQASKPNPISKLLAAMVGSSDKAPVRSERQWAATDELQPSDREETMNSNFEDNEKKLATNSDF
ncbi:hypothetical protein NL676_006600 [Syzygium grande]|nr:hypothetical protein NL676_006600 [Syzygium grande]